MTQVMMFNIEGKKSINIKMICHKLNIMASEIDKELYNSTIESILKDCPNKSGADNFSDEMLLLVDFNNVMLDIFLSQLKQKKSRVDLKAVLTETNKSFTPCELYKELCAEREAILNGSSAHPT
jgi:hypothetical protein